MTHERTLDRRKVLTAGAAALLASCDNASVNDANPKTASTRTLADLGKEADAKFVDSEGNPVNVDALMQSLKGKPSTLSFMYAACGTICPVTAGALHTLSAQSPSLKHVVVSVDPWDDFNPGALNLKQKLIAQGLKPGVGGDTIILYPTTDGTANPKSLAEGAGLAEKIQNAFDLLVNPGNPNGHSGAVTLFAPDGQLIAQAYDNSHIAETLAPKLAAIQHR